MEGLFHKKLSLVRDDHDKVIGVVWREAGDSVHLGCGLVSGTHVFEHNSAPTDVDQALSARQNRHVLTAVL